MRVLLYLVYHRDVMRKVLFSPDLRRNSVSADNILLEAPAPQQHSSQQQQHLLRHHRKHRCERGLLVRSLTPAFSAVVISCQVLSRLLIFFLLRW